ncbi:hypothetical protein [Pseudonocardia zijingensis]|jgi:hypothetical protein|uniref:Uncharacterized protein n=1 Tax=Pseudonocardia zijingensis TaxID=153376 RepID=A0ABN1NG13_9PSEU
MFTLIVLASGVTITPLIRFMLAGFEMISVGTIVLRITDSLRAPRLADLAAQRRERWAAAHPVPVGEGDDLDED